MCNTRREKLLLSACDKLLQNDRTDFMDMMGFFILALQAQATAGYDEMK